MSSNKLHQKLEASVGHWVRHVVNSVLDIAHFHIIGVGGILALEYYLHGGALDGLLSSGRYIPPSIYLEKLNTDIGDEIADSMNSMTHFEKGVRASSVHMLAYTLYRQGMISSISNIDRLNKWTLFRYTHTPSIGHCVMLDLTPLGPTTVVQSVAVLRLVQATKSESNMLNTSSAVIDHPLQPSLKILPFGTILESAHVSRSCRSYLMKALYNGNVLLHDVNEEDEEAMREPYHFALKSARNVLKSSQTPFMLEENAKDAILSYKKTGGEALVDSILNASLATLAESKTDRGLPPSKGKIGRYADHKIRLKSYVKTDPEAEQLLYIYSTASSKFNVACLLSGLVPEWEARMLSRKIGGSQYTMREYARKLQNVFHSLAKRYRAPQVPYKPMFVFRSIDLFELDDANPGKTVYNTPVPFDIVNNTFCSSSIRYDVASHFVKTASPCCVMHITIEPSYSNFIALEEFSGFQHEREILFPIGSVFHVNARSYLRDKNGRQVLILYSTVSMGKRLPKYVRSYS